jgi:hypothetical protein
VFGVAVLLGVATTIVLVTAISMEADLVGAQIQSGAFVYGLLSLADKLFNGLLIVFLTPYTEHRVEVLAIMTAVPAGSCILALLSASTVPTYWRQLAALLCNRESSANERKPLLSETQIQQYPVEHVEEGGQKEGGEDEEEGQQGPDLPPVSHPFLAARHMSGTIPSVADV